MTKEERIYKRIRHLTLDALKNITFFTQQGIESMELYDKIFESKDISYISRLEETESYTLDCLAEIIEIIQKSLSKIEDEYSELQELHNSHSRIPGFD